VFVAVASGGGGGEGAGWVVRVGGGVVVPASFVFEAVSAPASAAEVPLAGGALGVAADMIDIAVFGGGVAVRAADVAGSDVVDEVLGWAVAGAAVVEQLPTGGVGDQATPGRAGVEGDGSGEFGGDRPVSGQVCGFVAGAGEGVEGDGDVDLGVGV
jgi:hypothetical protein